MALTSESLSVCTRERIRLLKPAEAAPMIKPASAAMRPNTTSISMSVNASRPPPIARGQPLDAGEHPRIDPQGDGDRLGDFRAGGDGGLHQPQLDPVIGPKGRLRLFTVEKRNFIPTDDWIHFA